MNQRLEEIEEFKKFPSVKLLVFLNRILNLYQTNSFVEKDINLIENDYQNLIKILGDRCININPQIERYKEINKRLYFKNE